MPEKITIHNRTQNPLRDIVHRVAQVVDNGDVSQTAGRAHPCHVTVWSDGVEVHCRATRAGHLVFNAYKQEVGA